MNSTICNHLLEAIDIFCINTVFIVTQTHLLYESMWMGEDDLQVINAKQQYKQTTLEY